MRKGRSRPRQHGTPEEAISALQDSRRKYESSKAGKDRKTKWVENNRDHLNAYKRKWRKRKKAEKARTGPPSTTF